MNCCMSLQQPVRGFVCVCVYVQTDFMQCPTTSHTESRARILPVVPLRSDPKTISHAPALCVEPLNRIFSFFSLLSVCTSSYMRVCIAPLKTMRALTCTLVAAHGRLTFLFQIGQMDANLLASKRQTRTNDREVLKPIFLFWSVDNVNIFLFHCWVVWSHVNCEIPLAGLYLRPIYLRTTTREFWHGVSFASLYPFNLRPDTASWSLLCCVECSRWGYRIKFDSSRDMQIVCFPKTKSFCIQVACA